jgi:hypothetical protein
MATKEFNGHRSWNAWNVALWIGNDEGLYNTAREAWNIACRKTRAPGNRTRILNRATNILMHYLDGERTPDGAKYNRLCVREALDGLELSV